MSEVRAVLTDPNAPGCVKLGERPLRAPKANEAIVRVQSFSLNRGELNSASRKPAGSAIGWDVAGVVQAPAADGGPPAGTRVVGFCRAQEGWAEQVPIPLADLAPLPDGIDADLACTLPVAAGTALGCIDRARRLAGRTALVTGATGGVGGFAVQMLRACGAHVVAQVRKAEQQAEIEALGAHEVCVTEDGKSFADHGRFGFVMDGVGGPLLAAALAHLDPDAVAVTYGVTAAPAIELPLPSLFGPGRAALSGFNLYSESAVEPLSRTLARILCMVQDGHVSSLIERTQPSSEVGSAAQALMDRTVTGKVVLQVART